MIPRPEAIEEPKTSSLSKVDGSGDTRRYSSGGTSSFTDVIMSELHRTTLKTMKLLSFSDGYNDLRGNSVMSSVRRFYALAREGGGT